MKEEKKLEKGIKSHSDNEQKLFKKYVEEYNDLYPKILTLSTSEFMKNLTKRVEISIKTKFNGPNASYTAKAENLITEKLYALDYRLATTIKRVAEKRKDSEIESHYFRGDVIVHCDKEHDQKDGFYIHTCGERLQTFKYQTSKQLEGKEEKKCDIYLYCLKCEEIYKSNFVKFKCNSSGLDFYTKLIDNEESKKSEIEMPYVTWKKYHCNAVINDTIKCQICNDNLFLNQSKDILYCKKCDKEFNPNDMKYKCLICKETFKSDIKIYNPLEYKPLKMCVKEAIVARIRARPEVLGCGCNFDISKAKFLHKNNCKGDLFIGTLHGKKVVVCAKCDSLGLYEGYSWCCPECAKRFRNKEYHNINLDKFRNNGREKSPCHCINNHNNCSNSNIKGEKSSKVEESEGICKTNIKICQKKDSFGIRQNEGAQEGISKNVFRVLFSDDKNEAKSKENEQPNIIKDKVNKLERCESGIPQSSRNIRNNLIKVKFPTNENNSSTAKKSNKNTDEKGASYCGDRLITDCNYSPNVLHQKDHKLRRLASARGLCIDKNKLDKIDPENVKNLVVLFNKCVEEKNKEKVEQVPPIPYGPCHEVSAKKKYKKKHLESEIPMNKNEIIFSNDAQNQQSGVIQINQNNQQSKRAWSKENCAYNNNAPNHVMISRDNSSSRLIKQNIPLDSNKNIKDKIHESPFKNEGEKYPRNNSKNKGLIQIIDNIKPNSNMIISKNMEPLKKDNENDKKLDSITNYRNFNVDDYKIKKQIGQGSFGQILLVEGRDHKLYAMKKLIANSERDIKNIENEYQILMDTQKCTNNLNIVKLYGFFSKRLDQTTNAMYVLMELAKTDWEKEILNRQKIKDYYKESSLMNIFADLIKTFAQLQRRKISHRDVKPQNILVFENNIYKLADFGEAKELMKYDEATGKQTLRGTELYMSPILFYGLRSNKRIRYINHNTYKSDVFSFGLCALFAATLCFESLYDVRELKSNISIKSVLDRYLSRRYSQTFINLIFTMLDFNEATRKDFIELEMDIKLLGY